MSFDQIDAAARMREVIRRAVTSEIGIRVPGTLVGRMMSVDVANLQGTVWFPGDEQPVLVKLFATAIPGDWQDKYATFGGQTSIIGQGSLVVAERINGQIWVTQVLTGGQLSFGSRDMNQFISTQLPQTGDEGGPQLVGNSFELFTAAEVYGNISDGDAVMFGPFRTTDTSSLFLGIYDIIVQMGNQSVKKYSFASAPYYETKQNWAGGPAFNMWLRLLPEHEVTGYHDIVEADFDFEMSMVPDTTTPYPSGDEGYNTRSSKYSLWFRIIKRGTWGDVASKVSIKTTGFQLTVGSKDNRYGNEKLTGPLPLGGYVGLDGFQAGTVNWFRTEYSLHDNFKRAVTSGWGNPTFGQKNFFYYPGHGGSDYVVTVGSASSFSVVEPNGIITLASANSEQRIRTGFSTTPHWNLRCKVTAAQVSTGAAVLQRIGLFVDTATDDASVCRIDWGLSGVATPRFEFRNGGVYSTLATGATFSYTANQEFWVHCAQWRGQLYFKIWEVGDPEPFDFHMTTAAGGSTQYSNATYDFSAIRVTGNTNTNAVVRFRDISTYLKNAPVFPEDEVLQKKWHTGPFRSSLLRYGELLQRTMTQTGSFTWTGTHLSWTGHIILGGVGRNRNGLPTGFVRIGCPFPTGVGGSFEEAVIRWPQGDYISCTADGIPIGVGQSLWCGIPMGMPDLDISPYLFLVDSASDAGQVDLPEWAVLIASRAHTGPPTLTYGSARPFTPRRVVSAISTANSAVVNAGNEGVVLAMPSFTYLAGLAYEVRIIGSASSSVANGRVFWRIRKTNLAGQQVAFFARTDLQLANAGYETTFMGRCFTIGASNVTVDLVQTLIAENGNITHLGSTSSPRKVEVWEVGFQADYPNETVMT